MRVVFGISMATALLAPWSASGSEGHRAVSRQQGDGMDSIVCAINAAISFAVKSGFHQDRILIDVSSGNPGETAVVEISSPSTRGGGFQIEVGLADCAILDVVHLQ